MITTAPSVRGRFAPSPTGTLHLGNLRTALIAWLYARSTSGEFVVRIEDLDQPRVRPGSYVAILADLRWLGLSWDEGPDIGGLAGPYIQSQRLALYDAALARLRSRDLIYPCYCTRSELSSIASAPHGPDVAPRYPGVCRALSQRERRQREAEGRRPAMRFKAPVTPISFHDDIHGPQTERVAETVGDFIVRRSDGIVAYQLAAVVDDALMGITQIVRGADLLTSTARQLALYDALNLPRPKHFAHAPLAVDSTGARLAKRDLSSGLSPLRAQSATPEQVLGALAASCGLWPAHTPASIYELLDAFTRVKVRNFDTTIAL